MTSWRERIVAGRARGTFTQEDKELAFGWNTCAVGECADRLGICLDALQLAPSGDWHQDLGRAFLDAIQRNDFDRAEGLLNAIDDAGLVIKRRAVEPLRAEPDGRGDP